MFEIFRPNAVVESLETIDVFDLRKKGIKGIICDIDNTVLPWDKEKPQASVVNWIQQARGQGMQVVLLSNALPSRARSLSQELNIPARAQAMKPTRRGFRQALGSMGLTAKEVAMVGDQLFTDVLGGNRMGMYTILVPPLGEKEFFSTRFLRCLERKIKKRLDLV